MNRFLFAKHAEDRAPWTAARRPAGFVARSSRTAPGTHRRSRLASGPGGLQQNANLFLREPLGESCEPVRCLCAGEDLDSGRAGYTRFIVGAGSVSLAGPSGCACVRRNGPRAWATFGALE